MKNSGGKVFFCTSPHILLIGGVCDEPASCSAPAYPYLGCLWRLCSGTGRPLAYQSEAARLTLTGQIDEMKFAADLTLDAVAEGEQIDGRGFTLAYTAPASLCGLTFHRRSGETILTRGAITLAEPDGRWDRMIVPPRFFALTVISAVPPSSDRMALPSIALKSPMTRAAMCSGLDETGFPRRIEGTVGGRTVIADILRVCRQGGRQTILIPERKFPAMGYTYSVFPISLPTKPGLKLILPLCGAITAPYVPFVPASAISQW